MLTTNENLIKVLKSPYRASKNHIDESRLGKSLVV